MMNEEQAATAVYGCMQSVKKALGQEKAVGMVLGCVIGEILLSGQTKNDLQKLVDESWVKFQEVQEAAKRG